MLESNKKILLELLASSHTAEGQWNVGLGYNSQAHGWTFYTNVTWTWREMQKSVKDCLLPSLEAVKNRSLSFANWVLQISCTESLWCWTVYYSNCSNRSLLQTLTITVKAYLETPCLSFWNFCILCGGVWNKQLVLSYCLSSSRINWSGCISYVSLYFFFKWYNMLGSIVLLRVLKPGCGAICGPSWWAFRGSPQNWVYSLQRDCFCPL